MTHGKLAVFDFDGTLTKFDTTRLYVVLFMITFPIKSVRFLLHNRRHNQLSTSLLQYLLKGQPAEKISRIATVYRCIVARAINREVFARMSELRAQSDWTVLVATASPAFLVRPLVDGVPVVAPEYVVKNGLFTGETKNQRPYGLEKVKQVESFAAMTAIGKISVAYSDSLADAPLLDRAETAYLVRGKSIMPYSPAIRGNRSF